MRTNPMDWMKGSVQNYPNFTDYDSNTDVYMILRNACIQLNKSLCNFVSFSCLKHFSQWIYL